MLVFFFMLTDRGNRQLLKIDQILDWTLSDLYQVFLSKYEIKLVSFLMSIFSCFQTCQPINQNSYLGQLKMRGATLNNFIILIVKVVFVIVFLKHFTQVGCVSNQDIVAVERLFEIPTLLPPQPENPEQEKYNFAFSYTLDFLIHTIVQFLHLPFLFVYVCRLTIKYLPC